MWKAGFVGAKGSKYSELSEGGRKGRRGGMRLALRSSGINSFGGDGRFQLVLWDGPLLCIDSMDDSDRRGPPGDLGGLERRLRLSAKPTCMSSSNCVISLSRRLR